MTLSPKLFTDVLEKAFKNLDWEEARIQILNGEYLITVFYGLQDAASWKTHLNIGEKKIKSFTQKQLYHIHEFM